MQLKHFSLVLALALGLTACMDQDDPGAQSPQLYDVVELVSSSADGSVFALLHDDAPEVTLTTERKVDTEEVKVGESCVIEYIPESGRPNTSGPIRLLNYYAINNGEVQKLNRAAIAGWNQDKVYLVSIWRAGTRINMELKLPYDVNRRVFTLAVDRSTVKSATPQLYLMHQRSGSEPTFYRRYYASFDISSLWELSTLKSIDVHVANSNLNQTLFSFVKAGAEGGPQE